MKPIQYWEWDAIVASLQGPACFLVADGDYDRAVAWPDGRVMSTDVEVGLFPLGNAFELQEESQWMRA